MKLASLYNGEQAKAEKSFFLLRCSYGNLEKKFSQPQYNKW